MEEAELLRRELRAAREELVRKRSQQSRDSEEESRLPLMPDRDEEFLRLALMSIDDLEAHVERLERDLNDLEAGFDSLPDVE